MDESLTMGFFRHIKDVSRYESILLKRSWYFKIFASIIVFTNIMLNLSMLVFPAGSDAWVLKAVPSTIPYFNLAAINLIQAIIAIFLASDFLKRDKKLDTSEVFYVSPLSNAEYVFGKIWGNLRVFFQLNFLILFLTAIFALVGKDSSVDVLSYFIYFVIISVPTLTFIIGFSTFIMMIIKNQALTFLILLSYIGVTLFYLADKFHYLLDYMSYNMPIYKSTIVGFSNLKLIIIQRSLYLILGFAFIFLTISLFARLSNARNSKNKWTAMGIIFIVIGGLLSFSYLSHYSKMNNNRREYIDLNNKYTSSSTIGIDYYDIDVTQLTDGINANVKIQGHTRLADSTFVFSLNPGFNITSISSSIPNIKYKRYKQIIKIVYPKILPKDTPVSIKFSYSGSALNDFAYLDIGNKRFYKKQSSNTVSFDTKFCFQEKNFLLYTPEICWYPRAGTTFSSTSAKWQKSFFSQYHLNVHPLPNLKAISQGYCHKDSLNNSFQFTPEEKLKDISLTIGDYQETKITVDSTDYYINYFKGHNFLEKSIDKIRDSIPALIRLTRQKVESSSQLEYPFKRFSMVEVPASFNSYQHTWTLAQDQLQPELVFYPEMSLHMSMDVNQYIYQNKRWGQDKNANDTTLTYNFLKWKLEYMFLRSSYDAARSGINIQIGENQSQEYKTNSNPYYLLPQLYDYKYNISYPTAPIVNRGMELFIQKKQNDNRFERRMAGITRNEKANLLLNEYNLNDLLINEDYHDIIDYLVDAKMRHLMYPLQEKIGYQASYDLVRKIMDDSKFSNIDFSDLIKKIDDEAGTQLYSNLKDFNSKVPLPYYDIGNARITHIQGRDGETYVLKIRISNISDIDGYILIEIETKNKIEDPRQHKVLFIPAHTAKEYITLWDEFPRQVSINTGISKNLPALISKRASNLIRKKGRITDKDTIIFYPAESYNSQNEIIIDNEDSTLFSISKPDLEGIFPKMLDKYEKSKYKYQGIGWRGTPINWRLTTNENFYGENIRSAYVVKKGNGTKTATWKIPIKEKGRYDLYYFVSKIKSYWRRNEDNGEYKFNVHYLGNDEAAYLKIKKVEGWTLLGTYYFDADTVTVTLNNKTNLRTVIADAVKAEKRDTNY
ncbi:MAG: xanthan lyase [Bacteroidales bacterium]